MLSANSQYFAQIESLFEDKDFRLKVTRDELENMIKDFEPRYLQPIHDALRMADFTGDKINQIVFFGGGTRVPRVKQLLQDFFGFFIFNFNNFFRKEPSNFLNTDESVALGALYHAAYLSKGFKVKEFKVLERELEPLSDLDKLPQLTAEEIKGNAKM